MCAVKIGRIGKFDLNPRGELWSNDQNRIGPKLLSKFGWSQGKGLGKNEDGIVENLKVRMKMGQTGVGWDERLPIGIDYREYDAVLKDLSEKYQKPVEMKNEDTSLEKRSQQFKNRIHYQKFVRGKDISQYSEKDMSCIFLSREKEKQTESSPKKSTVTNVESHASGLFVTKSLPMFNSQLSIADYFAMKMKNKIGSNLNSPKESKSDEEFSQSEIDVINKKRKHESKNSKKVKRMKLEPKFVILEGSFSNEDDHILEASSKETPDENLASKEQFQNMEESCNSESMKKKKKSNATVKNFCNTPKAKQDIETCWQEEKKIINENSNEYNNCALNFFQDKTFDSAKESKYIAEEEVMVKKRKKEKKDRKKVKEGVRDVEISSVSESDDAEHKFAENVKVEKQSHKDSKRHKNKASNLKSCLKSCLNNIKDSFKSKRSVSFCENVSYRVIENVLSNLDSNSLEVNEKLLSSNDEDGMEREVLHEIECIEMNHVDDLVSSDKSSKDDEDSEVSCYENMANLDEVKDNTVPECFKLPKCSSTNYDSWLETQRIAARMKVYKNMVKKMKKHPVLRKTNLLEIKGYGNWGL